jgi:hypothetical protein
MTTHHRDRLVRLASQADHHVGTDVGMPGDPGQHPLQNFRALVGRGATGLVGEGYDTVDAGEVPPQCLRREAPCHEL